ncbi:threonine synthase [Vagococcus elongatus]|uniref:Threonine synthase n=1 Tax=Vagococcus elongatus TaxID=180344 RepID=A0A430B4D8_9ENTE|nr:threonine synthase [Vagococcus elongatus]RSU15168.1 threonine synthase [Vagococcus elongatus]
MNIMYTSTRDKNKKVTASQAILQGLSDEGGLFIPETLPELTLDFKELATMTYQEVAYTILKEFLTDFSEEELRHCIYSAYDDKFATKKIAPLAKQGDRYFLELFHGQTLAFKDMALSILPYLLTTAAAKNQMDKEIVILTATSGDTGKAAMAGFADVPGTKIIVFYPKNGVSSFQEKQMLTQKGDNTYVVSIDGNFDDAQRTVKEMFNHLSLKNRLASQGMVFSSANSINVGRLVPQIVYYVYAYAQLVAAKEIAIGEEINFSVPTGNFGNILAAYYAKEIGVPISRLICASNKNNVLTDFFKKGFYDKNRPFFVTNSPSMDILISSNLERLVYYLTGDSSQDTVKLMTDLEEKGTYELSADMKQKLADFYSDYAEEEEVSAAIKQVYEASGYVIDPHTAVAVKAADTYHEATADTLKTVIVSTASPFKFPEAVVHAIAPDKLTNVEDDLVDNLAELAHSDIPEPVLDIRQAPVRHQTSIKTKEMQQTVENILNIR